MFRRREERREGRDATRYQMRQRVISIGDDYVIENDHGERVFKVDGKALRVRKTLFFEDMHGHELCKIQERMLRVKDSVTALTAEAASFSGRSRGLTRAQPGPGADVDRPVYVRVERAVFGADHGVLPGAGAFGAAPVAGDAGVPGVHKHDSPVSLFRFTREDVDELVPASVKDRFVQASFGCCPVREVGTRLVRVRFRCRPASHVGNAQAFQCDHVAGLDERPRGLVVKVGTPVAESGGAPRRPSPSPVAGWTIRVSCGRVPAARPSVRRRTRDRTWDWG